MALTKQDPYNGNDWLPASQGGYGKELVPKGGSSSPVLGGGSGSGGGGGGILGGITAPLKDGGGFLSGLLGAGSPVSSLLGSLSGLMGGPEPSMTPDQNTNSAAQNLGLSISNSFQVGKGNTQTANPSLSASTADSTKPVSAAETSMDKNTLLIIGAVVVALILILFGARRR